MPATFDPTGHPRLGTAALALSAAQLEVYAMEAEAALGVGGAVVVGPCVEDLRLAVARQVNLTLLQERRGDGAGDVAAESKGDQSFTYIVPKDRSRTVLDELAVAIVRRCLAVSPGLSASRVVPNEFGY